MLQTRLLYSAFTMLMIVTGAQCFDRWFDRAPAGDREEFCRRAGLPDDRPFSSTCARRFSGQPVRGGVRASVGRGHPRSPTGPARHGHPGPSAPAAPGRMADRAALAPARRSGARTRWMPTAAPTISTRCTTARRSSGSTRARSWRPPSWTGRCFTILAPEFHENQEGTFHFHHLLTVGDGFLNAARTLDEHVAAARGVRGGRPTRPNRPFVEQLHSSPRRRRSPATPVFVETVESSSAARPGPPPGRRSGRCS